MRLFLIASLMGGCFVSTATEVAVGEPPLADIVEQTVQDFTPPWSPPRGELAGLAIGIHAAISAGDDTADAANDWSLMTANHLWHMVRRSGARPVPSVRDTTRSRDAEADIVRDWLAQVRETGCDACVIITCDAQRTDGTVRVTAPVSDAESRRLADAVAAEFGTEARDAVPNATLLDERAAAGIPVCTIHLPSPGVKALDVATRKAAHEHAHRIYRALHSVLRPKPGADDAPPPDEARDPRRRARLEQLARSIWPTGELPAERVEWFCNRLAESAITNRTLVYFDIDAATGDDGIALTVRTNAPRVARELALALRRVTSTPVSLNVVVLPDADRLGTARLGLCRAPAALTYAQPDEHGHVQTQLVYGEPLWLLDRADDHYLVHAGDGYWGWVHADAVQTVSSEQFGAFLDGPRATTTRTIDLAGVQIPLGARLPVVGVDGDDCTVLLPDGRRQVVPADAVGISGNRRQSAAQRVQTALSLLYTPYVFGGRSPMGLDCSGLATLVTVQDGEQPARDAWQQALAGELVATHDDRRQIRAGDQLFFMNSSGKIYHTGLAISNTCLVHSAPPCVQINSLDPQHPLYDAVLDRDLFVAKRR